MSDDLDRVILALASIVEGDRALGMEASAMTLGVPVRTFEKLAARPGFPKPAKMGRRLTWRRLELMGWWDDERDRQHRAA